MQLKVRGLVELELKVFRLQTSNRDPVFRSVQCDQLALTLSINLPSDLGIETPVDQVALEADNNFGPIDEEVIMRIC
jgi:hypothetical protein